MGTLTGYLGQKAYNKLDGRRTAAMVSELPNEPKIPLWRSLINSKYSPVTLLSDEEYRKILEDRLLRVDVEIAVLDDDIESVRKTGEVAKSPSQNRQQISKPENTN